MDTVVLGAKRKLIVLQTLLFDVLLVHARTSSSDLQIHIREAVAAVTGREFQLEILPHGDRLVGRRRGG